MNLGDQITGAFIANNGALSNWYVRLQRDHTLAWLWPNERQDRSVYLHPRFDHQQRQKPSEQHHRERPKHSGFMGETSPGRWPAL